MKAIVLDRPGSPETLHMAEVSQPVPQKGEIRVQVHAVGLNPVDYKVAASGNPAWRYPFILGLDVAGVVDAVGEDVTEWKKGDRVLYHGDLSKPGGYAEYAVTTAHTVAALPDGISFEEAAALPCAGLTAYQSLFRKVNLQNTKSILIHAGAGGVGGFAIQFAALHNMEILTTCSKENFGWVKELGAHYAIDYKTEDVDRRIGEITSGRGVDIILNTVSPESAVHDLQNLAFNGQLVCIVGSPDLAHADLKSKAFSVHLVSLGAAHGSGDIRAQKDLAKMTEDLLALVDQGKVKPMLTETISLEDIPSALKRLSERHVRGKIVAKVK